MKNKFEVKLGKALYGWVDMGFYTNDKEFFHLSISGVYNPFYDLVDLLKKISLNKNGSYKLEIDQEGKYGVMNITVKGNKITLETHTITSKKALLPFKIIYNKKQFLCEFINKLNSYYIRNKSEIVDDFYDLSFDIIKLRKINI